MKRRKILALLTVGALLAGTLSGCGGDSGASGDAGSAGSTGEAAGESADAQGGGDDTSPITFEYYNADGKDDGWSDTPVGSAIADATGVRLEITYPVSSTGDPSEDVALMIANDEYPDLIYSKTSAASLYEAGALIDMTDLIEQYGPNIKKMYGDEFEKLKSYLAAHPTTEDGLETIGMSMSAADWHWMITLANPAGYIADAAPDNGSWLVDENYNCIFKQKSENEREYFKWLSRMYDEGILDPNFATQTDDDYIAKLVSGRVIAITDANWHYYQAHVSLNAEGKTDKTYCGLPVTLRADQKAPSLMYQGLQVGYGIAITKSCEDPVRAIKFLDYLCSDEGAILYRWGIEGEHYFLDENGMRYRTEE